MGPALLLAILTLHLTAESDFLLWPVSPLERIWPDSVPRSSSSAAQGAPIAATVATEGARGEVVTAQLAVRSGSDLRLKLAAGDLVGPGGAKIPASGVRLFWQRRISLTRNTPATPAEELDRVAPCDVPDPFWEDAERDVARDRTEGIWIEIRVPRAAPAGAWRGSVALSVVEPSVVDPSAVDPSVIQSSDTPSSGGGRKDVPVDLTVWDFAIPERPSLHVVQWFTFPGIPFDKTVERYSERWWGLLEKFARIVAEHRQDCFQAPFHLIRMRLGKDGRYVGDFSRFDRWVETFLRAGPFERIELGFVARLEGGGLTDPASRLRPGRLPVEMESGEPRPSDEDLLRGYLGALHAHLEERGWLERSMVHIHDEPFIHHEESYREVARLVAEAAPGLRRIDAIEAEDFFGSLEVWVPKLSHLANWYDTAFRRAQESGAELWFYTCCHPTGRYPNRFLDYPLLKTRVLHWIGYLHDLDGYLHWGLNHFWGDDPFSEAGVSQGLPPGDRAVCYPASDGYLGSLRWSAMRDGLEDFEYLRVLEERLRALKARHGERARRLDPRQRPLEICRRVAWSFRDHARDPEALLAARREIAAEIAAVERGPLRVLQTSPPDGFAVPPAPRVANLWGIADPGSEVRVDGRAVANVAPDGVFFQALFLRGDQTDIVVEVRNGDRTARAVRRLPP